MPAPADDPAAAVALSAALIRCPSVTPAEAGALTLLEGPLRAAGFDCRRVDRDGTPNLFARWGAKGHPRTFGFNGHTDVVPPGDPALWRHDPFGGVIADGVLWGRGATDMKTGVAAFVSAAVDFVTRTPPDGAVILTVTGDEEGAGEHGTRAILDHMAAEGERMTVCLVGEPTSRAVLGDMMKIGRRGSMSARLTARGRQGHSAYPHLALNPLHALVTLLGRMMARPLDAGTAHFDASTLALTTVDTGNSATNVIPAEAVAGLNIRFNDLHSGESLSLWLREEADAVTAETGVTFDLALRISGEAFLTPPGALSGMVAQAVEAETGRRPEMSTSGGTSDARFIRAHCPVVEFGLTGQTMHQTDERIETREIEALTRIYRRCLQDYFA